MKIKYLRNDPRAGMIADVPAFVARRMINSGYAKEVLVRSARPVAAPKPAVKAKAPASAKAAPAPAKPTKAAAKDATPTKDDTAPAGERVK